MNTFDRVLEHSRLFRVLNVVVSRMWQARRTSIVAAAADRLAEAWRGAGWRERRRAAGLMLSVGAAVHVGLSALVAPPPGWLWLILPGLALAIGVLLLAASGTARLSRPGPQARPARPARPAPDDRGVPS